MSGYNVMYPDMDVAVIDWLEKLEPDVVVAFDPATRVEDVPPENLQRVLARATWLLCNRAEAAELSGEQDPLAAANSLAAAHGSLNVVVRTGAEGCVVATRQAKAVSVSGFRTTVLDTTGAGDVHNGVFLAELTQGLDPLEAARRANAAAAMSVALAGPATSPTRPEVDVFLANPPLP